MASRGGRAPLRARPAWLLWLAGLAWGAPVSKIYWTDTGANAIRRCDPDGSSVETVLSLPEGAQPRGLAVSLDDGLLYWAERGTQKIMRARLDGGEVTELASSSRPPEALVLGKDRSHLYWTDCDGRLERMPVGGGTAEGIVPASSTRCSSIAVNATSGRLYWPSFDRRAATIWSASADGSDKMWLMSSDGTLSREPSDLWSPQGLALDAAAGKVYWADDMLHEIYRAGLDGTDPERLAEGEGVESVLGLAVDAAGGKLYWADRGYNTLTSQGDAIMRSNLNGSGKEVLVAGDMHLEPRAIALAI